ncbi:sodium-coupled monocarboxylate transporter 1 [Anabrus simplex]|uniref:sodium-coupled monocarboxylate transporter 1 n=1 Tax=Anabrus simplex TaxID=316456 RepID=UPI0035A2DB28
MDAPSVQELGVSLQRFGIVNYAVFVLMLLLSAAIGVYYGFFSGKVTADDYLMGGRTMKIFPVAMSLIASFFSGITLLGTPTEMYLYGSQYIYSGFSVLFMGIFMSVAVLPVLHDLRVTSAYEYLEMRFNKYARLFGSVLFVVGVIFWMPVAIYVPALAFNQVTGVNVHVITPVVCLVCIFYTCVGGLRAVVWADVIQGFAMFGAMILVAVKGTFDVGGADVVWQRNLDSGRIESPNLSVDPLERHTFLVLVVGGLFQWTSTSGINQSMMQRYLCLPTLRHSRIAISIFVAGSLTLIMICCYCGLLIYATYYDCDPLTTKLAAAKDQLLPLMVMRTLGEYAGLPGCFVAGVFSAALSSMSTALNSMSAVVLEDFFKTFRKTPLTERQTNIVMKSVVVIVGSVCVGLVFVVEKMGSVLQMSTSLEAVTGGPGLGIFCMALFLPWVNSTGMLVGGTAGLSVMVWIVLGAQAATATGRITFPTKPLTIEGCTYSFIARNSTTIAQALPESDVFVLFRLSYLWYACLGCSVTLVVALVVSFITGANDISTMDYRLLSPVIRRFLPEQKQQTISTDLILASGYKTVELHVIPKSVNGEDSAGQKSW